MIVYYRAMRVKDDEKRRALVEATIKLVNELGFAASSVSKIAKEAGVSSSTLYIYFDNKEDLLVSSYLDIKIEIGRAVFAEFDPKLPVRDIFFRFCTNLFDYMAEHNERAAFMEQFACSPLLARIDSEEFGDAFKEFYEIIEKGKRDKIIKDVPVEYLGLFMFHPITKLAVSGTGCAKTKFSKDNLDIIFDMAWDAIRI